MAHAIHPVESIASNKAVKGPQKKKGNLITSIVGSYKAKRRAKKIIKAIDEAEQIHKGNKKGKSFDDFLTEI